MAGGFQRLRTRPGVEPSGSGQISGDRQGLRD
ncbi:hypothetical protein Esi_0058_0004 [Ectocarpus siliculosus]|uniref:Uncharacterized protein n=1 Tax=Ectocarpus siliculosus TaxID=2880 RepID=D7G4Q0_ECTSI|nr:hypothetical protein Esi_0058_0004 [Ectocarpus siliculosus]|eukprot:CBJ27143.1 hypothetical protein Esi_0058_0004 [Ectocarpus siliculosus]